MTPEELEIINAVEVGPREYELLPARSRDTGWVEAVCILDLADGRVVLDDDGVPLSMGPATARAWCLAS